MSAAEVVEVFRGYDDGVIDNAIPWLALQSGVDVATAPPPLQSAMLRFAERAGLKPGMSKDDVQGAVQRWFDKNPLPEKLVKELGAVARRLVLEGSGGDEGARGAAARLLGEAASKLPVGSQPVPEGAVKNSPFARFQNRQHKK